MYYPGLEGKNVLLIGGHSNLGQHVTQLFAEAGANVVIGARDLTRAEEVAAKARRFKKGEIWVTEIDATNSESVERAVAKTRELGSLDVLYQGVGWGVTSRFLELDPEQWDTLYQRNLKTVLLAYRIALPIMIEQKSGCMITMSSVSGRRQSHGEPVYGALKCAVIFLAQALALEVAQYGVRINVVAPGPTPPADISDISENSSFRGFMQDMDQYKALLSSFAKEIPLRQLGTPENVAHAVLYLASPVTGGYQTGQVIGVDGGWWMPK